MSTIEDGRIIGIKFTRPLIGDIDGYATPAGYKKSQIDLTNATITSLNEYSSSYSIGKAFDGDTSTYWYGTTMTNWIKFQLSEPKAVTRVRMYLGSNYISTFTLSGSNDNETWTQIGDTYWAATTNTLQWYDIDIENTTPYLYYKIDTYLGASSSSIYLYELQLCEDLPRGNEGNFKVSFWEYDYVPGGTLQYKTREIESVKMNTAYSKKINLNTGQMSNTQIKKGIITLDSVN